MIVLHTHNKPRKRTEINLKRVIQLNEDYCAPRFVQIRYLSLIRVVSSKKKKNSFLLNIILLSLILYYSFTYCILSFSPILSYYYYFFFPPSYFVSLSINPNVDRIFLKKKWIYMDTRRCMNGVVKVISKKYRSYKKKKKKQIFFFPSFLV